MPDRCPRALWVAGCLALACGGTATDASLDPKPASVTPNEGSATQATAVVVSGTNFLARPVQPASGGQPTIDTRHHAWIGDVELQDVVWVDAQTLQATVPAGVPPGAQRLVVENALGRRGELASAFLVRPNASLQAALAIGGKVSIGQEATLTLTLTNPGTSPVANVTPTTPSITVTSGAPAITVLAGPTPSAIPSIDPGQSAAFTWTLKGSAAGGATVSASAAGTDGFTQDPVSGSASAPIVLQQPAALAVTVFTVTVGGVSRTTLNVGQAATVTLTLQNTGEAAAAISASIADMAGMGTCGASSPPAPLSIEGGASATLTWSCTPSAAGTAAVSASVTATDANSGANVSPTPSSTSLTIQTAAALTVMAFTATSPATFNVPSPVTLTLQNTGGATAKVAQIVTTAALSTDPTQSAGPCTDASPPPPLDIAGGATVAFTWTCAPLARATTINANAAVSATDANSGADVSPTVPSAPIRVNP